MTNEDFQPFMPPTAEELHDSQRKILGEQAVVHMKTEEAAVRCLGLTMGFGRLMQLAQQEWRAELQKTNIQGGEFCYGPCVSGVVVCGCQYGRDVYSSQTCDWCCGAGWLTRKVREAQLKDQEAAVSS